MKGYIYLIENKINKHKYIGKTYSTIEQRWKDHIKTSKREISKDRPLYRAINKYGIENFEILEIEYCEDLEEREKFWIKFYNTYKDGYNATLGGDGKCYFEIEDKIVIDKYLELKSLRNTALFFCCNEDTIRKRLNNNNIEIEKKVNIFNLKRSWKTLNIDQYTLEGMFIQSFNSLTNAAKWLIENKYSSSQIKHIVSNVSKCAKGIEYRKQAYGFIWKFPV